jgi:hypothetical protein
MPVGGEFDGHRINVARSTVQFSINRGYHSILIMKRRWHPPARTRKERVKQECHETEDRETLQAKDWPRSERRSFDAASGAGSNMLWVQVVGTAESSYPSCTSR